MKRAGEISRKIDRIQVDDPATIEPRNHEQDSGRNRLLDHVEKKSPIVVDCVGYVSGLVLPRSRKASLIKVDLVAPAEQDFGGSR